MEKEVSRLNTEVYSVLPPRDDFEKMLCEVRNLFGPEKIPNMAVREIPMVLEEGTKDQLMNMSLEEVGRVLVGAIEKVNMESLEKAGRESVEKLDRLVQEEINSIHR